MRALLALTVLLAGCQKDFDERYAETEARVKEAEARLDARMKQDARAEQGKDATQ
jgi:hypothetical protein